MRASFLASVVLVFAFLLSAGDAFAGILPEPPYDIFIKYGPILDPKKGVMQVMSFNDPDPAKRDRDANAWMLDSIDKNLTIITMAIATNGERVILYYDPALLPKKEEKQPEKRKK